MVLVGVLWLGLMLLFDGSNYSVLVSESEGEGVISGKPPSSWCYKTSMSTFNPQTNAARPIIRLPLLFVTSRAPHRISYSKIFQSIGRLAADPGRTFDQTEARATEWVLYARSNAGRGYIPVYSSTWTGNPFR